MVVSAESNLTGYADAFGPQPDTTVRLAAFDAWIPIGSA